jgi:hypothetical protein
MNTANGSSMRAVYLPLTICATPASYLKKVLIRQSALLPRYTNVGSSRYAVIAGPP